MADFKTLVREIAPGLQLIAFATLTETGAPWVRYVAGKVADDLTIRFSTHLSSRKVAHIWRDPRVHITLGATDIRSPRWLQFDGRAEISIAAEERRAFWFDGLKQFVSGVDDPEYCIVIVRPSRVELGAIGEKSPRVFETGNLTARPRPAAVPA